MLPIFTTTAFFSLAAPRVCQPQQSDTSTFCSLSRQRAREEGRRVPNDACVLTTPIPHPPSATACEKACHDNHLCSAWEWHSEWAVPQCFLEKSPATAYAQGNAITGACSGGTPPTPPSPTPSPTPPPSIGSCVTFGCTSTWVPGQSCQCNPACPQYQNCCSDYIAACKNNCEHLEGEWIDAGVPTVQATIAQTGCYITITNKGELWSPATGTIIGPAAIASVVTAQSVPWTGKIIGNPVANVITWESGGAGFPMTWTRKPAPPAPTPPASPAKSCADVAYIDPRATDGEYVIQCAPGAPISVWCHDLRGDSPREFLSLHTSEVPPVVGAAKNYASYFCGDFCKGETGKNASTVTTAYSKIRINPCTLEVDISELTFTTTNGILYNVDSGSGRTETIDFQFFGVAEDCEGGGANGEAHIDLSYTPLVLNNTWSLLGSSPVGTTVFTDALKQKAKITGGGFCGVNAPARFSFFENRSDAQWALQLAHRP